MKSNKKRAGRDVITKPHVITIEHEDLKLFHSGRPHDEHKSTQRGMKARVLSQHRKVRVRAASDRHQTLKP